MRRDKKIVDDEKIRQIIHGSLDVILQNQNKIIQLVSQRNTPFYFFDKKALEEKIDILSSSFKSISGYEPYYPVKINHHSFVLKTVIEKGLGLEVASVREMKLAIDLGCKKILFFCPGKTNDDLVFLLQHNDKAILNIDSFGELEKIGRISKKHKKKIRAIVRIHGREHSRWEKFGIPLKNLFGFWEAAKKYNYLDLMGIHFHSSRNSGVEPYTRTIKELAKYLVDNFSPARIKEIEFIDFGGGFEVDGTEGFFEDSDIKKVILRKGLPIDKYASAINDAINCYLVPLKPNIKYLSEVGRAVVDNSMHIALRIVDVKDKQNLILNGGVNMVGWQRFEYEYFPVINLSNPANTELRYNLWGNLCATWDIWGYYCYASKMEEGDLIIIPNQGTLAFSLAQNFINEIPKVYKL